MLVAQCKCGAEGAQGVALAIRSRLDDTFPTGERGRQVVVGKASENDDCWQTRSMGAVNGSDRSQRQSITLQQFHDALAITHVARY